MPGRARPAGRICARACHRPGDGSLVVKDASGPRNAPVVSLIITGAAIGHVEQGRIIIDDPTPGNDVGPVVTGAESRKDLPNTTAQVWSGTDFKFRAVGGKYTIIIYGSGVDVVAFGQGTATLTGLADDLIDDGTYSLNGSPDFQSLPGRPTKLLTIGTPLPTSSNGYDGMAAANRRPARRRGRARSPPSSLRTSRTRATPSARRRTAPTRSSMSRRRSRRSSCST